MCIRDRHVSDDGTKSQTVGTQSPLSLQSQSPANHMTQQSVKTNTDLLPGPVIGPFIVSIGNTCHCCCVPCYTSGIVQVLLAPCAALMNHMSQKLSLTQQQRVFLSKHSNMYACIQNSIKCATTLATN